MKKKEIAPTPSYDVSQIQDYLLRSVGSNEKRLPSSERLKNIWLFCETGLSDFPFRVYTTLSGINTNEVHYFKTMKSLKATLPVNFRLIKVTLEDLWDL